MTKKIEYIDTNRTVNYFDINFKYYADSNADYKYKELFTYIIELGTNQDPARFVQGTKGKLFTSGWKYVPTKKQIRGKLYFVREDIFPQIIKLTDESIRDFEVGIEEGMLETTHFIIDYSGVIPKIGLEYNHYGARITDFMTYLQKIGRQSRIIITCNCEAIVYDRLKEIKRRINRLSKVRVKVHKDNILRIKSADNKLGSALFHAQNFSLSDEVELILKFDYKKKTTTTAITDVIQNSIHRFISTPKSMDDFNLFEIEAEDEDNNNNLELFNLISDKVTTYMDVQKRINSRVINSRDYYEKSEKEMNKLFNLNWNV